MTAGHASCRDDCAVDAAMLAASLVKHVQNRNRLATLGVDI